MNTVKSSVSTGLSRASDSAHAPSGKAESTTAHDSPGVARMGDLNHLSDDFLATLISTVKANAGIVRVLPAHSQALQVISSAGMTAGLLEAESTLNLDCELRGKTTGRSGIYSSDISDCKIRQSCKHIDCRFKSIVVATLENRSASGNQNGVLSLFFNTPQEESMHVSKTVLAFAHLLNTIIEHNKFTRGIKRIELLAERQSIANEIHDSLAQTLVYARMRTNLLIESIRTCNELMAAKYAHDIDEALESAQKTVRELIADFRCEMDPSGLLHALQILVGQFCERNNIALEYINRVVDLDLTLEYEIQIYYIVREALANIATHSGATNARLIIETSGVNYVFTIEDNGRGGCTSMPAEGHYGMTIMRERAARINGEIKIESTEGSGTLVQLSFQDVAARVECD